MDRTQKQAFVTELNAGLKAASALLVAQYRGLTVKELTQLRRDLAKVEGKVQVAKNRLAKIAFKGTPFEANAELMKGPTLLAYSSDMLTASKVAQGFADKNDKLVILGGMMDGKAQSPADIKTLSKLPSLNELRGKLVGLLQAPAAQLARVTKAYADKGGASAAPAAEAPKAEAEAAPAAETAPAAEAAAPAAEAPAEAAAAPVETPNA
jgi:large subunit ribosomal protein L10